MTLVLEFCTKFSVFVARNLLFTGKQQVWGGGGLPAEADSSTLKRKCCLRAVWVLEEPALRTPRPGGLPPLFCCMHKPLRRNKLYDYAFVGGTFRLLDANHALVRARM